MSKLVDFFNKIKNRFLPSKRLQIDDKTAINPVLKEKISQNNLFYFENPNNYNDYCKNFFREDNNYYNQYDYLQLVSQMQTNGAMTDFERYYAEIQNNSNLYYPSRVHGIEHTSRVTFYAEILCSIDGIPQHEKDLIMRAAQLHDIGREDDGKNFDHGLESRYKIEKYGILSQYSPKDQEIIKFAVESHSLEPDQIQAKLQTIPKKDRKNFKKILDYLQDADKLDRTRIANKGWGLDPNRLETPTAKRLVKFAHVNYYEFNNVINYEANKNAYENDYNNRVYAFNDIRQKGYNITFDDFNNIINQYKPGVLENLMIQGRIEDIFSYKTFMQYNASVNQEILKQQHDSIFKDIQFNEKVTTLEETFDNDFMLYYNLKVNNPDSYNIYKYANTDCDTKQIIGVANQIQLLDKDKLFEQGYDIRLDDLYELASNLTPEEYRYTIDSGNFNDLFSSKYEKNSGNYQNIQNKLKSLGLNYDKDIIDHSYRFIEKIIDVCPEVLKYSNISNYSFLEIYNAVTKMHDSSARISKNNQFDFTSQDIIDFMDYSRYDNLIHIVNEEDQLDIVEKFVENRDFVKDPRYIQYMVKKNKPYTTHDIGKILNYNKFCADSIIADPNITLKDAKLKLINGLFNIDVPPEYRDQFEKELMQQLYYHKKYYPQSQLYENENNPTSEILDILSTNNINEFKNLLSKDKQTINSINTHNLGDKIKLELMEMSKIDIAYNLQNTANEIHSMRETNVISESGRPICAKVLSGQKFYLATSTAMPKCSALTGKIIKQQPDRAKEEIYNRMLQTPINPNQNCTSITSDEMLAHASSALQDQELIFGFVPESKESIFVAGMYDLSTKKDNSNIRFTNRPVSPRNINDFVNGTNEEHNEAVMNAYPDFIICYDKITDIAIEKQRLMQEEYDRMGIDKKIDLVLIEGKEKYIPQIKEAVLKEHQDIEQKLDNGTLTKKDFNDMFEKHESNFVLRTLQSIHSTSYRDDVWDRNYNSKVLESMTRILGKVAQIVPNDKARAVLDQVDILLQRADRSTYYGSRFYDHTYANDIDTMSLENIKNQLTMKVLPYEQSKIPEPECVQMPVLKLEEINTNGINRNYGSGEKNIIKSNNKNTYDDAR